MGGGEKKKNPTEGGQPRVGDPSKSGLLRAREGRTDREREEERGREGAHLTVGEAASE